MKIKNLFIFALISVSVLSAATLSGVVKDNKTKKALDFANIAVYEKESETIKTGTMSGVDGCFRIFNLPEGKYYLVISYMGYEKKQVDNIIVDSEKVKLGAIHLNPALVEMENVIVEAEKAAITYKIDKQVVDATQFPSARGGTAIDILENVPTVIVDIDRKVKLLNSSSFTVMIDGRPSILEPQNALETIPADLIDNIEIMLNPSAKYQAEGGGGVINIVTKRNKLKGISGLASLRGGTNNMSGTALLSYRNKKISTYLSLDYRLGKNLSDSFRDHYLYLADTTVNNISEGIRESKSYGGGIKGGLDWHLTKNDVIGFSTNYSPRNSVRSYMRDFTVIHKDPINGTVFNTQNYMNYDNSLSRGMIFNAVVDYSHTFPEKEKNNNSKSTTTDVKRKSSSVKHQMKFIASYSEQNSNRETRNILLDEFGDTTGGKWSIDLGPTSSLNGKFNYKRPLRSSSYFETGASVNFNWKSDGKNVYDYEASTRNYILQEQFSNLTAYKQNTMSAFGIYSTEIGKLGFQPGIRAEYTYREINSDAVDSVFVVDSLNVFPSLHLSYLLPGDINLMASYSRRIERPSAYQLQPFYTWQDAYHVSIGNPALKSEMIDLYSLSIQKSFKKCSLSLNTYYSRNSDRVERIQTLYQEDENVILGRYENVGKDQSLGVYTMVDLNLFSWWRLNVSGNIYYHKIEGTLLGEDISKETMSYSANMRSSFVLPTKTRIQIILIYMPKITTLQGSFTMGLMPNLSLSHDFLKGKLSASLSASNFLGLSSTKVEYYTPTTYTYTESSSAIPKISLSLSLKINNYKRQRSINALDGDGFNSLGTSE